MILVPRPAPHLPRTLSVLQQAGLKDLYPLALSHPESIPAVIPTTASALLITSPLGVQTGLPTLPAYCVGEATASAATMAGLKVVYTGSNNGASMAQDINQQTTKPTHFAHLHGDHAHMDWHTILTKEGHTVTPVPAYQTRRVPALPPEIVANLRKTNAPLTLLFSAGSALHLANLYKQVNITPTGTAIAFSPLVARAATHYWPKVVTAAVPTLEAMVTTIRQLTR